MSTIASQANFDALITSGEARYSDTDTDITSTGEIVANPGYIFTTSLLQKSTEGSLVLDNCIVNFTEANSGRVWTRGDLQINNGQLVYTHSTGNMQFPGFVKASNDDRPTYQLENLVIRNYNGGTVTNHFGNMSLTAPSNLTGIVFGSGAVFIPYGAVPLVGITFSADTAAAAGFGTGETYFRINQATNAFVGTLPAAFSGMYRCDLSLWDTELAADRAIVSDVNATQSNFANPKFFMIDNIYSSTYQSNGISFGCQTQSRVIFDVVSGQSWFPVWYEVDTTADIEDLVFNGLDNQIYFCLAPGTANTTEQVGIDPSGGNNYITYYDTGSRRPGYIFETDTQRVLSDASNVVVTVPQSVISNIPFWSYTHSCYSSGNVLTRNSTTAFVSGDLILDPDVLDIVELGSDSANLNGRNLATAQGLQTSGITDLDDAYSVLKSKAYDDRVTSIDFSAVGKAIVGATLLTLSNGTTAVNSTSSLVKTTSISGGTVFDAITAPTIATSCSLSGVTNGLTLNGSTSISLNSGTANTVVLNAGLITFGGITEITNSVINPTTSVSASSLIDMTDCTLDAGSSTSSLNNFDIKDNNTFIGGTWSNIQTSIGSQTFTSNPRFIVGTGATYTFLNCTGDFTLEVTDGTDVNVIIDGSNTPTLVETSGTISIQQDPIRLSLQDIPSGANWLMIAGDGAIVAVPSVIAGDSESNNLTEFTNQSTDTAGGTRTFINGLEGSTYTVVTYGKSFGSFRRAFTVSVVAGDTTVASFAATSDQSALISTESLEGGTATVQSVDVSDTNNIRLPVEILGFNRVSGTADSEAGNGEQGNNLMAGIRDQKNYGLGLLVMGDTVSTGGSSSWDMLQFPLTSAVNIRGETIRFQSSSPVQVLTGLYQADSVFELSTDNDKLRAIETLLDSEGAAEVVSSLRIALTSANVEAVLNKVLDERVFTSIK